MTRDEIITGLEREIKRIRKEPREKMLGIFMTVDEAEDIVALLKEQEAKEQCLKTKCIICPHCNNCDVDENGLLKEQEAVEPRRIDGKRNHFVKCGNCNYDLLTGYMFCPHCGKTVK